MKRCSWKQDMLPLHLLGGAEVVEIVIPPTWFWSDGSSSKDFLPPFDSPQQEKRRLWPSKQVASRFSFYIIYDFTHDMIVKSMALSGQFFPKRGSPICRVGAPQVCCQDDIDASTDTFTRGTSSLSTRSLGQDSSEALGLGSRAKCLHRSEQTWERECRHFSFVGGQVRIAVMTIMIRILLLLVVVVVVVPLVVIVMVVVVVVCLVVWFCLALSCFVLSFLVLFCRVLPWFLFACLLACLLACCCGGGSNLWLWIFASLFVVVPEALPETRPAIILEERLQRCTLNKLQKSWICYC